MIKFHIIKWITPYSSTENKDMKQKKDKEGGILLKKEIFKAHYFNNI